MFRIPVHAADLEVRSGNEIGDQLFVGRAVFSAPVLPVRIPADSGRPKAGHGRPQRRRRLPTAGGELPLARRPAFLSSGDLRSAKTDQVRLFVLVRSLTSTCFFTTYSKHRSYFCTARQPTTYLCGASIQTHVTSVELHQTVTLEGRSTG